MDLEIPDPSRRLTFEQSMRLIEDRYTDAIAFLGGAVMPAGQFDELAASLDVPDGNPNLARAFERERRFRQDG